MNAVNRRRSPIRSDHDTRFGNFARRAKSSLIISRTSPSASQLYPRVQPALIFDISSRITLSRTSHPIRDSRTTTCTVSLASDITPAGRLCHTVSRISWLQLPLRHLIPSSTDVCRLLSTWVCPSKSFFEANIDQQLQHQSKDRHGTNLPLHLPYVSPSSKPLIENNADTGQS